MVQLGGESVSIGKDRITAYILDTTAISVSSITINRLLTGATIFGVFVVTLLFGLLFLISSLSDVANFTTRTIFFSTILLASINIIVSWKICKRKLFNWKSPKKTSKPKVVSASISKSIIMSGVGVGMLVSRQLRGNTDIIMMIFMFSIIVFLLMIIIHFWVGTVYQLYLLNRYCPELKNKINSNYQQNDLILTSKKKSKLIIHVIVIIVLLILLDIFT